jgi:hypothetical protein
MSVRVIYRENGHFHCLIGEINNETPQSYVIEYVDHESITGKTNLKIVKKSDIVDIVHR